MLKAFLKFKAEKQAEVEWRQESLFSEGFATPSRMNSRERSPGIEYVSWAEVQSFLQMAEQALKVRTATNEALSKELKEAKSEKCQVEKTSSAAQEESSFLAESMAELMQERAALREALERAQREKEYLVQENALLRQELLDGAALGEESSAALHLFARQGEDLREAQQRNAQLENDNVQLQARVSALERANTAQATAMLSCLEESERTRLQQLTISICESPVGPLAGGRHRASEFTDDSSAGAGGDGGGYADAYAELGSDGSYVSCITPLTTGSGGGQSGSIFHSPDTSPDCAQQQQRRQQQQAQSQRQPSRQHSSSGKRDNFSCS